MTEMVVVRMSHPRMATVTVMEERRTMVQAARLAAGPADPTPAPPLATGGRRRTSQHRRPSPYEQTVRAVTAWAYMAPFLMVCPFFLNPPGWLAALSLLRPRDDAPRAPRPPKGVLDSR